MSKEVILHLYWEADLKCRLLESTPENLIREAGVVWGGTESAACLTSGPADSNAGGLLANLKNFEVE